MIRINIAAVGKIKEQFWKDALSEYSKRISKYFDFKIFETQESTDNASALKLEEQGIISKLRGTVVLLDVTGDLITSEELADFIKEGTVKGVSEYTFVIGSSRGVSDTVKAHADKRISFGRVTYPHQMMRVILTEQIYRAGTIIAGGSYHK